MAAPNPESRRPSKPNPWMAEYLDINGAMLDPETRYHLLYDSPDWRPVRMARDGEPTGGVVP